MRFIEQIFKDLRRAAWRRASVGRAAATSSRVRRAMSRSARAARVDAGLASSDDETPSRAAVGIAVTEAAFRELEQRVEAALDAVTLADLCERARNLHPERGATAGYVYTI